MRRLLGLPVVLAVLGLVAIVLVLTAVDDFRSVQLTQMAYLGIAAGGLTVLTGLNGQISLGHGALMAIGAYTTALLLQDDEPTLPLLAVLVVATVVTLVVGAAIGVAAARLHGPYLAGATLALAVAVPGIALYFGDTLGGEQGLRVRVPDAPGWVLDTAYFVTGQDLTPSKYVALLGWSTLVVTYLGLAHLSRGRVGRRWRAVRDDEVAAEVAGISLGRARVSAFVVSAAAAGAAGFVMALSVRLAAPSGYSLTLSLTLLTAVVLGGLGSLTGALLGAALLTFLPQIVTDAGVSAGLDDIRAAELAPLIYGLVLVAVILLAPAGLVGSLRLAWHRPRRTTPRRENPDELMAQEVVGTTAVLTSLVLVAACGAGGRSDDDGDGNSDGGSTVGVTDDSIAIGGTFPLTGVAAPGYSEIPTGAKAYFDFVNAAGGVNGRQIDFTVKDDGYDPTKTSSLTNELVLKDQVFATVGSLGTPTHSAVVDFLNEEEVPDLFVSSGSLGWGEDPEARPMTFGWQPDYEIEGKVIGQYVAENMPDAKVGLFVQDDDFGEDAEKGVRQFLDDQVVDVQRYTSGNTDVGPQMAALQAKKPDIVLAFTTPSYTALAQLTSLTLGFKPQWYVSNVGSDPALVGSLLEKFSEGAVPGDASALNGVMSSEYIPGIDAPDNAWVQLWQKVWDENGGQGELTNYRIYGMSWAYTFVQALQAAGEDLTREGLVDALEEVGSSLEGPNLAPYRYSEDSHLGISGMELVKLENGKGEPLTKVLTTDIGDAEITEDSSGQADDAPPESGIPDVDPVG